MLTLYQNKIKDRQDNLIKIKENEQQDIAKQQAEALEEMKLQHEEFNREREKELQLFREKMAREKKERQQAKLDEIKKN